MSDTSQGPGWWIASDGRWYPPESHPSRRERPAPPTPPQRPQQAPPKPKRQKSGTSVWKVALGVCLGLFLFVVACSALISSSADKVRQDLDEATREKPAKVRVEAASNLCWSGSVGGATQEGCGNASYDTRTDFGDFLSVFFQKKSGPGELTVVIEVEGEERGRNSTSAEFGVVTVSTESR